MYNLIKRLLKHSVAYAVGTVLNRAVSIILLPLYTRYLTKAEYGILEILLITSTSIVLILQLGMSSALFRSILYKENTNRKVVISTAFYFVIFCSGIGITLLFFYSDAISLFLFGDAKYAQLLQILFICDLFLIFNSIPMAILRIDQKSVKFAMISSSNFIIGILLNILFLVIFDWGLEGILLANTITAALFWLIYLVVIRKEIGVLFSGSELRDMLSFGLPLVPNSIGDLTLMMSDRYFLRYYWGLEQVASYGAAFRIGMIMSLAVNAFQMAWPAMLFSLAKEPDAPKTFSKLFNYYLFVLSFLGLGISIFAKDILFILATEKMVDGAQVVPLISLSFIFYGMYYYTSVGINVEKKTYLFPMVMGLVAVINVGLNFLLVPKMEMMGSGLTKMISYMILGLAICKISQNYYKIPYNVRKIFLLAITSTLLYLMSTFLPFGGCFSIVGKVFLFVLFPIILFKFNFFEKSVIDSIKRSSIKLLRRDLS